MIPVAPNGQKTARAAVLGGLAILGDSTKVSTQLPPNTEALASFVVLSLIGGDEDNFATDAPRFLFECYAKAEVDAEDLAHRVRAALKWARGREFGGVLVRWTTTAGPVKFDNPDAANHFRFQFTGEMFLALQ